MVMSLAEYELQAKIVKETIKILESRIKNIHHQLEINPNDTMLKRDLRNLTMDMTITMNELEQTEKVLDQYYSENAM